MSRKQLAIAVREPEYMKRLADYVRDSSYGDQWQIIAFTSADACLHYVKQGYSIDFIAASPAMLSGIMKGLPKQACACLVKSQGESEVQPEVMQYQALPQLLKELTGLYDKHSELTVKISADVSQSSSLQIIAVHSAAGGTGKTALALHLAHAAAMQGKRTFYFNLERWNTAEMRMGATEQTALKQAGLSDFLYVIKTNAGEGRHWLAKHSILHPVMKADFLPGFANLEDRMSLEPEDGLAMVDAVAGSGRYRTVIIDLDASMDELTFALLERSHRILSLVTLDPAIIRKQEQAWQYGKQRWGGAFEEVLQKTELVRNDVGAAATKGIPLLQEKVKLAPEALPRAAEWKDEAGAKLLTSSSFRAAANALYAHVSGEGG
ncbi:hypothetical protein [Paenibacillus sp. HB172176]|uniref:hypothetical protein n=1 Tax=Paenibacillus sp. HB172176 TaxID=2493690 RepID=UPI00143B1B13|nr:hypothetical protein [Paenibacillus sp. HB172176]